MEKISVIIPCYNVENYVEECLESVINQTVGYENLEIILVDDCSEDGTLKILEKYEERYTDNIILITSERNGKQGTARNIGLNYASGNYISFVDADDYISLNMYEILLKVIKETESEIVEFNKSLMDVSQSNGSGESFSYQVFDIKNVQERKKLLVNSDIMGESCITKFYTHDFLRRANVRFGEGVAYEEPLFTYPLKFWVNRIARLDAKIYFYRSNVEGTTLGYMGNPSTIMDHLVVQWQLLDCIRNLSCFNVYREEAELHFLHAFFAEPFYFLKLRGIIMPVGLFRYMCRIIKMVLPDFRENFYVSHDLIGEEAQILGLISESESMNDEKAAIRLQEVCEGI